MRQADQIGMYAVWIYIRKPFQRQGRITHHAMDAAQRRKTVSIEVAVTAAQPFRIVSRPKIPQKDAKSHQDDRGDAPAR